MYNPSSTREEGNDHRGSRMHSTPKQQIPLPAERGYGIHRARTETEGPCKETDVKPHPPRDPDGILPIAPLQEEQNTTNKKFWNTLLSGAAPSWKTSARGQGCFLAWPFIFVVLGNKINDKHKEGHMEHLTIETRMSVPSCLHYVGNVFAPLLATTYKQNVVTNKTAGKPHCRRQKGRANRATKNSGLCTPPTGP